MPLNKDATYNVVIVGGGIAGMATAIGLIRRGIDNILVLEKANTMHPVGASIAIFSNGLKALHYLSPTVATKVKQSSIPIENMIIKDLDGNVLREKKPPSDSQVSYLVWYLLQEYLAQELPTGTLQLGTVVESFQVNDDDGMVSITAYNRATNEAETITTKVLVCADGIHSPIRQELFGKNAVHKLYHGKHMYRSVLPCSSIENPPPTGINIGIQGDEPGKLFSYRETARGILTVTAMACFDQEPTNDKIPSSSEEKKQEMMKVFEEYPSEVQAIVQQLNPESIHVNPIQDIDVLCDRWSKEPVIVIGNAAHAISPSLGQGANQGLEDAAVLVHVLSKGRKEETSSTDSLLQQVYENRIERVKLIHAASRARSMMNNESNKTKPVDMTSEELRNVLEEIDAWDAPVDDDDE